MEDLLGLIILFGEVCQQFWFITLSEIEILNISSQSTKFILDLNGEAGFVGDDDIFEETAVEIFDIDNGMDCFTS